MNFEEKLNKKHLSKEEKAELLAYVQERLRGRVLFPEALAEARKYGELLKKAKLPPSFFQ